MRARKDHLVLLALAVVLADPARAFAAPADVPVPQVEPAVDVIVALDGRATMERVAALAQDHELTVRRRFSLIDAVAARVPTDRVPVLERAPGVLRVEPDSAVEPLTASAQDSFGVSAARLAAPGLDGAGLTAAVVDTGIDASHQDLDGGKVVAFANCLSGRCVAGPAIDDNGHGTHVAGILAGDHGVAPAANLVGVKVLDASGGPPTGAKSRMIAGIEWVVDNREAYGIDILNLSLGIPVDGPFGEPCSDGTDVLSVAADRAVAEGILVVAAAGNSGPGPCSVASPAVARDVLTVGNMADLDDAGETAAQPIGGFRLHSTSSRGPTQDGRMKPDVAAPGVEITSAKAGTVSGHQDGTGTSMAAPFVAGVGLLLLDASPALTPQQVKDYITGSAVDWGTSGADPEFGAGRLDAHAALRAAGAALGEAPAAPVHEHHAGRLGATGEVDAFSLPRADGRHPIAVTLIIPAGSAALGGVNADLRVRAPGGAVVATASGVPGVAPATGWPAHSGRQEDLGFRPGVPGTYTLEIVSAAGGMDYRLDVSRPAMPPASTALPTVSGEPRVGVPLAASAGDWEAAPGVEHAFAWSACGALDDCKPIPLASAPSFTPTAEHLGRTLRVRVTATDAGGSATSTSAATAAVAAGEFASGALPSVAGERAVGRALAVTAGEWSPAPAGSALQWLRCTPACLPIAGSTGAAYTLTAADLGADVRVRETVSRAGYGGASAASAAGEPVAPGSFTLGRGRIGVNEADLGLQRRSSAGQADERAGTDIRREMQPEGESR